MTLKQRRILHNFFVFLFLIISPLISLYAAGYKVNFRAGKIQKTGTLIIKTKPKEARIYLNGRLQKKNWQKFWLKENILTTPAKIGHLLPGQYKIILKKDGYWPWQKQITLLPGQSVNLENILLFKKDTPLPLFYLPLSSLYPSPDKKTAIAVNNQGCFLLDFSQNKSKKILSTSTIKQIAWSNDSKKLFLNGFLINLENNKTINLVPILATGFKTNNLATSSLLNLIKNVRFYPDNHDKFYYLANNSLYSFDIELLKQQKIISTFGLQDAVFKDNYLAIIKNNSQESILDFYSADAQNLLRSISLPIGQNYTFVNLSNEKLNLYEQNKQILYLLNPYSLLPLEETIKEVKLSAWQGKTLLYANDFEIWLYSLKTREKKLITRLSQPIKTIFWHPAGKHIFFSTQTSIFITELTRDHYQNITPLVSFQSIKNPFLSTEKKEILFSGQIGAQVGIYKLRF